MSLGLSVIDPSVEIVRDSVIAFESRACSS